jgi:hypothetical protein
MHETGLTIPEEDDISLYYSMASGFWITRMPYMGDLDFYHMNDWPERKRRRTNDFYRECVRRQLYQDPSGQESPVGGARRIPDRGLPRCALRRERARPA